MQIVPGVVDKAKWVNKGPYNMICHRYAESIWVSDALVDWPVVGYSRQPQHVTKV